MPSAAGPRNAITRSVLTMRALFDVRPRLTPHEATDLRLMDPVLDREGVLADSASLPPSGNLSGALISEFRVRDRLPLELPAFGDLVGDVVCMRPGEQVRGTDTPDITTITEMQDAWSFWARFVAACRQDVGNNVNEAGSAAQRDVAASFAVSIARPDPARSEMAGMSGDGTALVDARPETILDRDARSERLTCSGVVDPTTTLDSGRQSEKGDAALATDASHARLTGINTLRHRANLRCLTPPTIPAVRRLSRAERDRGRVPTGSPTASPNRAVSRLNRLDGAAPSGTVSFLATRLARKAAQHPNYTPYQIGRAA